MGDHHGGQIGMPRPLIFPGLRPGLPVNGIWWRGDGRSFMPEGFNAAVYQPRQTTQDIPVSFIGGAYGYRPEVVNYLLRHGCRSRLSGPAGRNPIGLIISSRSLIEA